MAQLQSHPAPSGKRNSIRRPHVRIDMTPMVDLGFLLITFFIFTTSLAEPKVSDLYVTAGNEIDSKLGESTALTVLLTGGDSIFYYQGKWEDAVRTNGILPTSYDVQKGLGDVIRTRQKALGNRSKELMLLIKPIERSTYNNLMNALDEVLINDVKRYAIMDATESERSSIEKPVKR